jgi:hypothetical protein
MLPVAGSGEGYCPFSEPVPFGRAKAYILAINSILN